MNISSAKEVIGGHVSFARGERKKKESLQDGVFPGGHPSKYLPRPMGLNFGDRTRTGVFPMVWS